MTTTPRSELTPRFLFAGDRSLAVSALGLVLERGHLPTVLCVSDRATASHAQELERRFRQAGGTEVIAGSQLREADTVARLQRLDLDFAISVHFPELVRSGSLEATTRGWLNLHPAYLPFNRGWHTPSWALLEHTPIGATIHVMTEEVDAGPILARGEVLPRPDDTAHTLYQRVLAAELELLAEHWDAIATGCWELQQNPVEAGTVHHRADLDRSGIRALDLEEHMRVGDLIDRLRALTTNDPAEAACFTADGANYRIRIEIEMEDP
jgi:methionyl-tRNA formyltransferase